MYQKYNIILYNKFITREHSDISISNHMAVGVIWDISPALFCINFEITPSVSEGDIKIDEK